MDAFLVSQRHLGAMPVDASIEVQADRKQDKVGKRRQSAGEPVGVMLRRTHNGR